MCIPGGKHSGNSSELVSYTRKDDRKKKKDSTVEKRKEGIQMTASEKAEKKNTSNTEKGRKK